MEENRKNYRIINITTAVLGMVLCIGAFFIPVPEGLLADESSDLFHALMPDNVLTMFAVPGLMVILSAIIVMISRPRWLAIATALAGGALYVWMDYGFAMANQTCEGTLVNAIGIVLIITASLLEAFATPSVRQLRREEKLEAIEESAERKREARIFFDDASEKDAEISNSFAEEDDGIDINELRYETLRIESKDLTITDRTASTESKESWSSDNDLEALLMSELNEVEEKTEEQKSIEERLENIFVSDTAADKTADDGMLTRNTAEFYGALEEMFLDE